MPHIKAFRGIHPAPEIVGKVALQVENLSLDQAKDIRQENPYSYVNMLVPDVENPYLRGSKKELAYKKINENFEEFIEKQILVRENNPSVYVYQVACPGITQTGIWTLTSIDDYLNNTVKKHEHTLAEREKNLADYLQQTGIDANPVLITYLPDVHVNKIMQDAVNTAPVLDFAADEKKHRIWKIDQEEHVKTLTERFAALGSAYIADGHHRAAAACNFGIERRKHNLKHRGTEEYNFFSSVYMSADQIRIFEFNRLVRDMGGISAADFLTELSANFNVQKQAGNQEVKPDSLHHFGMYLEGNWYLLHAREHTYDPQNPVSELDVSILQDYILKPLLRIEDPRTDNRLEFFGGMIPVAELVSEVNRHEQAVAFILYPTSIDQLIRVADAGEVMPPKSTWFEPKFQSGLLVHEVR